MESKERNGRNDKKELKKLCFSISHEHAKNLHSHMKWNKKDFGCSSKGKSENWFCMTMRKFRTVMRNAPGRRKWCWWIFHFAQSCEICIFSRFLGEKASERPLRWCQVSTWPWPKIETWFTHFGDFYTFSNCRMFQISSLYIIFYFPSFSLIFSLAKHALWDQIFKHEWLNLVFLGGGRI